MATALSEAQLREIEAANAEGLTSQEIVRVFADRKVRFSEANLRRYVQLGLVPRSYRVGQKGRHQGSRGVYPIRAVRRINLIKKLMAERYTLEEIQDKFLAFKDDIETLDDASTKLIDRFEAKLGELPATNRRERLFEELALVRRAAAELLDAVHRLEKMLIPAAGARRPRGGGVADPTELL
ncbi:MerR family transcriptional regulator [Pseudenhygromyxa sp. WMMC2535]|uniref:MerR family transcriptional regulator n=1 Tax=Pseudenhygromyxa sp. WMMC2535 TaxID=2712867 RepID=UPI001557B036|nr:MerR family transcriptional regulator [Pseudenhygromyxa sp. WMMC2535]NVB42067.1 MerR family transcriptional regulator [Pseudenhygromyxa sp. WMMC2535]